MQMNSFATFLVAYSLILLIMANNGEGGSLGVNFGRQASQKLLPSMVVDMCLANEITKVKLFSVNEGVMGAFANTNIELIVALPNVEFTPYNNKEQIIRWMKRYIVRQRNNYVDISHICVGVEPFEKIEVDGNNTDFTTAVAARLKEMADFINDPKNNLTGKVRFGVPSSIDILEPVSKPSQCDFRKDLKKTMLEVIQLLNKTDSPFMINLYPYLSITRDKLPLEFGLFENQSNFTVTDGKHTYKNVFDLEYDKFVWALRTNGFGNMKIMVSQIGWPTDGGLGANVEMAKRFYDGLLKKVKFNEGTPLVPRADLDVYLYELADENQKLTTRGSFEKHYGIYRSDGKAKFNLDFTLQGRDIEPEPARGVLHLPQRWCILNTEAEAAKDEEFKKNLFNDTCYKADCTALNGSCSFLDENWKISYAFNIYFQMSNQEVTTGEAACDFKGLGKVVTEIPTFEGCDFPVQILSTLFINGQSDTEMAATLGKEKASNVGERPQLGYQLIVIIALWVVFFHKGRWL